MWTYIAASQGLQDAEDAFGVSSGLTGVEVLSGLVGLLMTGLFLCLVSISGLDVKRWDVHIRC
jgi:hypothetical protein